jgi:glycosyltransferase involved in cell wall biosynthesis
MSPIANRRVIYVYPPLFKYRAPFQEKVRENLSNHGIEYQVAYCDPPLTSVLKADTTELSWAIKTPIRYIQLPKYNLIYQDALSVLKGSELIIMQHESKLLLNYILHMRRIFGPTKISYFGHGRNFQSSTPNSLSERMKRFLATKVDWWFAYNDLSARLIEGYGFPADRITSFRNAIDTKELSKEIASVSLEDLEEQRKVLRLEGSNVGAFIGGIYEEKRISFLIDAAKRIRQDVPDFELLIIGGGPQFDMLTDAVKDLPYIRALGPQYGREKTELAMLAKVFLMPGLVGLAVLDSFAYRTPMITTDYRYHSPEIDYLRHGINGWIARPWHDVDAYASAVTMILRNSELRERLSRAAGAASTEYSIEDMASRFTDGVLQALGSHS